MRPATPNGLATPNGPATPPHPAPYRAPGLRGRQDGWTVERQRQFLAALAETGCVSTAADAVGLTPRSAYRLRQHPRAAAFAQAWTQAQLAAGHRLLAVAYDRAINGAVRTVWRDGEIATQTRIPSDRLIEFLLGKTMPHVFGPHATRQGMDMDRVGPAQRALPTTIEKLCDLSPDECPVEPGEEPDEDFPIADDDPTRRC